MARDYVALDAAIVASLKQSPKHFTSLFSKDVRKQSELLAGIENAGKPAYLHKPAFRFVDTRLQVLRKAEKILHSTKTGWQIAE